MQILSDIVHQTALFTFLDNIQIKNQSILSPHKMVDEQLAKKKKMETHASSNNIIEKRKRY